jgi:LPS sulfotransferase NodH
MGDPREYFLPVLRDFKEENFTTSKEVEDFMKKKLGTGIESLKIMANHIIRLDDILNVKYEKNNKYERFELVWKLFKDAKFIKVTRLDKVSQAVSRIMAEDTKVYHIFDENDPLAKQKTSESGEYIRKEVGKFNPDRITREIKKIEREELILNEFIECCKISPFYINYEDAISENYINEVAKFCNKGDVKAKPRTIKKIAGDLSLEWIAKYKKLNIKS